MAGGSPAQSGELAKFLLVDGMLKDGEPEGSKSTVGGAEIKAAQTGRGSVGTGRAYLGYSGNVTMLLQGWGEGFPAASVRL